MEHLLAEKNLGWVIPSLQTAAKIAMGIQRDLAHGEVKKKDDSPVTVADYSIQAYMGYQMSRYCPRIGFVAEESSELLGSENGAGLSEKIRSVLTPYIPDCDIQKIKSWIDFNRDLPGDSLITLDPIDGTKGYLRGDHYATAIAFIHKGVVEAGALACPMVETGAREKGILVFGVRGRGAYKKSLLGTDNWQPIHVSDRRQFSEAVVLRSFESKHTHTSKTNRLLEQLGIQVPPVCLDSMTKYALLAEGKGDIFLRFPPSDNLDYREWIWDQAAGVVLIEEAGGKVTDIAGKPLDFRYGRKLEKNSGVVATNGILHASTLKAIEAVLTKI